ncbi:MAG: hypothetical protein J3R72DRAFT_216700 [Linnemannia gamsii]|nr:MAG: hypothetical protein J3R72DRAFT_216700 [Linnemannia gamsii]
MRFNLLIVALVATVVSALPTRNNVVSVLPVINTTFSDTTTTSLSKRAECRSTTLKWVVNKVHLKKGRVDYFNTFHFEVNYHNGQGNYVSRLDADGSTDKPKREACQSDKVWCVEYYGHEKSEWVGIKYGGHTIHHDGPNSRQGASNENRGVFEYWDCFPW